MEPAAKKRLGDIFVERRLITHDQLAQALEAQRESGGKLGETLVELGFVSRVDLAGVISEQWDELRLTTSGQKHAESQARRTAATAVTAATGSSVIENVLRERIEALTVEVAMRDQRIAQQDATIAALLSQLGSAAA